MSSKPSRFEQVVQTITDIIMPESINPIAASIVPAQPPLVPPAPAPSHLPGNRTEADAQADIARAAVQPPTLVFQGRPSYLAIHRDTALHSIDHLNAAPARSRGRVEAETLASFVAVVKRFASPQSIVYCHFAPGGSLIEAILNDHGKDAPGWGDHTARLPLDYSSALVDWLTLRAWVPQVAFAEFLQMHARDIKFPDAASIMELILNFEAVETAKVTSRQNLRSGAVQLCFEQDSQVRSVEIPKALNLQLSIYEDGEPIQMNAPLRYRIRDGKPVFSLIFPDLDAQIEEANAAYYAAIQEAFPDLLVLRGVKID